MSPTSVRVTDPVLPAIGLGMAAGLDGASRIPPCAHTGIDREGYPFSLHTGILLGGNVPSPSVAAGIIVPRRGVCRLDWVTWHCESLACCYAALASSSAMRCCTRCASSMLVSRSISSITATAAMF